MAAVRLLVRSLGIRAATSSAVRKLRCTSFLRSGIHLASCLNSAIEVRMPSLSPTMQHGTIVKWHKKEGDSVAPGDLLCDVQTDKAVVGFEFEEEGILAKILKPDNSSDVPIGSLIALIVEPGEDWQNVTVPADVDSPPSEPVTDTVLPPSGHPAVPSATDHDKLGPAVRSLLEVYNIQPNVVSATGPHSRLLKGDLLKYIKEKNLSPAVHPAVPTPPLGKPSTTPAVQPTKAAAAQKTPFIGSTDYVDNELSNMRSVIAKRLTMSKTTIPHSYATIDCNLDNILDMRKKLAAEGVKVGVNDFLIKAAAVALQRVPEVNALWSGDAPQLLSNIDISVAVATDNGLITPIVKDAVSLGIDEIAERVKDLASRARAGKLQLEEFQGGSFTISNLGMFGITSFTAVINPPQACILAVGAARQIVECSDDGDESVNTTTVVSMTSACDARIVDDTLAAQFLATMRDILENPSLLLSHRAPPSQYKLEKLFAK